MTQAAERKRGRWLRDERSRRQNLPPLWFGVALALAPCALLIGLVFYQVNFSLPRLEQSRALVDHTYEIVNTAQLLVNAAEDAERGQRGFLLSNGDARYLEPYTHAVQTIPDLLSRLRGMVADTPERQRALAAIDAPLSTKLDELAQTLDAYRKGGSPVAMEIFGRGKGIRAMGAFLAGMRGFIDAETGSLRRALKAASAAEDRAAGTMVAASAVAVVALVLALAMVASLFGRVRRSRQTLRTTLDAVPVGVAAVNAAGDPLVWNDRFLRDDDVPAGGLRAAMARLAPLEARAREVGRAQSSEEAKQTGRVVEFCVSPIPDGGFVALAEDITERKATQAFYAQAQKMDAIGQMTGGIAHDFNNLLTIIMGSLERLSKVNADDPRARRHVELAMMGAERGAKLNRQLLAFARRQPLEPTVLNAGSVLAEIMDLVRRTLGERIEVEVIRDGGLWNVLADRAQLESAVLNLALNARDAMPDGGKLTIETANASLNDAYAARHDEVTAGQYMMLAVTDTGTGMATEILARALDPFFTTKEQGKGTGLGLSQIFGFAKQSGGHLKLYSEPGHGTTVKLYLPRSTQVVEHAAQPMAPAHNGENAVVLVVEDDRDVRATVMGMLADLGYRTMEASDGAQALAILRTAQPVDLLFTDVVMPGPVTSRAMAEEAARLRPGIRVLFTSGYTENSIIHQGRLDPGVQLLSKPYRRDELAARLRAVLGNGAAAAP